MVKRVKDPDQEQVVQACRCVTGYGMAHCYGMVPGYGMAPGFRMPPGNRMAPGFGMPSKYNPPCLKSDKAAQEIVSRPSVIAKREWVYNSGVQAKKNKTPGCPDGCKNAGKPRRRCDIHWVRRIKIAKKSQRLCCPDGCKNAGNRKTKCAIHGGSALCPGCKLTQVQKMGDFCRMCVPIASRKSRVREARMAATLKEWASKGLIPEVNSWNKQNPTAEPLQCGKFRPDFVYEWNEGLLVLEYDEQMHSDRLKRCELIRMGKVTLGYGDRPVFWVRFNPDAFKVDGKTLTTTRKTREEVLLEILQDTIGHADYDHFMTVFYLFYNKPENTPEDNYVQKFQFKTIQEYEKWVNSVAPEDEVMQGK